MGSVLSQEDFKCLFLTLEFSLSPVSHQVKICQLNSKSMLSDVTTQQRCFV